MFGNGNWGVFGQGDETSTSHKKPVLVDYFVKNKQKIVDMAVGQYHTIALTDKGEVYSWGYGGRQGVVQSYL